MEKEERSRNIMRNVVILILLAIITLVYSLNHYADGGCDGGLCALLIFVQGVPLLISWLFTIVAYLLYYKNKLIYILFLILAIVPVAVMLTMDYGSRMDSLENVIYVPLLVQCYLLYLMLTTFTKEESEDAGEGGNEGDSGNEKKNNESK